MATSDVLSGLLSLIINVNAKRTEPSGRDTYKTSFSLPFDNTETKGDNSVGKLYSVFHEEVTVTATDTKLILDTTDPMGALGTNSWSQEPTTGARLKVIAIKNLKDPTGLPDDNENMILIDQGALINAITAGFAWSYTAESTPGPSNWALGIQPGGLFLWVDPRGAAIFAGAANEIGIKVKTNPVQAEIFLAVG